MLTILSVKVLTDTKLSYPKQTGTEAATISNKKIRGNSIQ